MIQQGCACERDGMATPADSERHKYVKEHLLPNERQYSEQFHKSQPYTVEKEKNRSDT